LSSEKYKHINFVPPKSVADAAVRGLDYRKKSGGKGGLSTSQAKAEGIGSGVQRAVNLKNRDKMSPDTVRRMKAFFDRHQKNKKVSPGKQPWEDRGYVAWLLWGGDPGYSWSRKVVIQMEAADKKEKMKKTGSVNRVIMAYVNKKSEDTDAKIVEFLKKNPKPSDDQVHELAEDLGINKHDFEEKIYQMLAEKIGNKKEGEEDLEGNGMKGIVVDIETDTKENSNFRKVLYTGKHSQLVLMALKPGEDIGDEVHDDVDQFFRIDDGSGKVIINGNETKIKDGSAFIIPAGSKHNVIAGDDGLKLYSVYSPPNHEDKTLHKTKEEAMKSEEKFEGKTTEGQ